MTDIDLVYGLGVLIGAVAVYGLIRYRIIRATQDFRVAAAVEADALFNNANVHPDDKRILATALEEPFSGRRPWRFALLLLPVSIYMMIKRPRLRLSTPNIELQKRIVRTVARMSLANVMASPVALLLIAVQIVAIMFALVMWSASLRSSKVLLRSISLFFAGHDGPSSHHGRA